MRVALVVPLKSFAVAKGRMAAVLSDAERAELARRCAAAVVRAAEPWPVFVVSAGDEVRRWSHDVGATCVADPGVGLDGAVDAGRRAAVADGAEHIVLAHGDLPLATTFAHLVVADSITLVPDRRRDGTNVIAVPADSPFSTAYGPGSFNRHVAAARALGLVVSIVADEALSLDLDTAEDLAELTSRSETAR